MTERSNFFYLSWLFEIVFLIALSIALVRINDLSERIDGLEKALRINLGS